MARRVFLVDDFDGSPADHTVRFTVDDRLYQIDLTTAHRDQFMAVLEPFMTRATVIDDPTPARRRVRAGSHSPTIRAWALDHGLILSDRGRVPIRMVEAYRRWTDGEDVDVDGVTIPAPDQPVPVDDDDPADDLLVADDPVGTASVGGGAGA